MDFDPYGLTILSTYKHGSASLRHEAALHSTPQIRWMGIRARDVHELTSGRNLEDGSSQAGDPMPMLSARDRKRAVKLLDRPSSAENGDDAVWRSDLQLMLMLNRKAEIEILHQRQGGLLGWLRERLGIGEDNEVILGDAEL